MAKRYDIVIPKKYEKDGEEKTAWKNVGTLVRFPATEEKQEGYILELNMFPDTTFKVFEQKPRDTAPAPQHSQSAPQASNSADYRSEDINPDDIPF